MPHNRTEGGWIELVCGSMFSGKTEELIRRVNRAIIAKQKVQVFKPVIDTRYAHGRVTSHSGAQFVATPVADAAAIRGKLEPDTEVVAIDEAQFFDRGIVDLCKELADRGLRVIVASLDMDFRGEPFGPVPVLMAQAEEVTKLRAICQFCGADASRTQRLINGQPAAFDDPVILVGAKEVYEARCRKCHRVAPAKGAK